jgi:glyoxylase-like metal-dependent hydrolase (beta-lactamase superfamily II)
MLSVKSFIFNPVQENSYILYNEKGECCIIDPGCYFPEEKEELKNAVEDGGLKPVLLLNTHCHLDHVFGNRFVRQTWGLDLHIHPREQPVLDFAPESGKMWQLSVEIYEGPIHYIREGERIKLGDDELEIRFTPGHSPGSISFYNKNAGFVIAGDVLFEGSIGRTDLPGGDFDTLANSIRTQLYTLPDETRVYSGHGQMTTIGREKETNPFVRN